MRSVQRYIYMMVFAGSVVVTVLLLISIGSLLDLSVDKYHLWRMTQMASEGQMELDVKLVRAQDNVDSFHATLEQLSSKVYPDLQAFKQLAGNHRVRLRKMERVSNAGAESNGGQQYTATLEGSVGRLVSFLKALEDTYILKAPQVSLYPIDSEGKVIALYLVLTVRQI